MTTFFRRLAPATALVVCSLSVAPPAAALTQSYCSFPSPLTTWTLNQSAFEALGSEIRLTTATTGEAGSAFLTAPIPLASTTSFHAHFRAQLGPSATGGDGLAFILQNSAAGANAIGATGVAMGYGGITPSVIVELDTFKNAGDTNANHVGLMLNGSATHTATGTPSFTMAGGGVLNAWIDYDAVAKVVKVYLAQSATKPATPIVSNALNLFTQLGSQMFVGFSAATGATAAESNQHDAFELELSTDGTPCTCEGDAACSGATPACSGSGICTVCTASNHTACTGATPVCNASTNSCVGCLTNGDCSGATPICDKGTLTCRACTGNADCGGLTPQCATSGPNGGSCVLCVSDSNCPPNTPRCTTSNTCTQCLTGADCGGNTPVCKNGSCKACASDADCGGGTPACEVWGACGQCTQSNPSACTGAKAVCDYPTGTCVGCEFNSDCSGSTPTCNTSTHACRACQANADCVGSSGGPACATSGMKSGSCVACTSDSDCTSAGAPKCDTTANVCVTCLSNTDCSGSTPICSAQKHCVGCVSSTDCSGAKPVCDPNSSRCQPCQNDYSGNNPGPLACPTAALPACQLGGTPLAGQCGVCSSLDNAACATQPTKPVCITSTATCGCVKDSDCNADSYCDTSSAASGVCAPGCRVVGGVTNCATGKYCTKTDGSVGQCLAEACNSNADCSAPNGVCNTIVQPHTCVQCLNDPDCGASQVCDKMSHCVECTSDSSCGSSSKGPVCLANETCGCAKDSDCGGASSGEICDTTAHACVAGCRGTGGNGCPAPKVCSSTGADPGTCATPASDDAGTGPTTMDASAGVDGASPDGGGNAAAPASGSSCGCRVAGEGGGAARGAWGALLVALVFGVRQSRSRKSRRTTSTL